MRRLFLAVAGMAVFTLSCYARDVCPGIPKGWSGDPPDTIAVDGTTAHSGKWSVRLERDVGSFGSLTALTRTIPVAFTGAKVEFRAFLKTEDVRGSAGLWVRQDGESETVAGDNTPKHQLKSTAAWAEYSILLPLESGAKEISFGVFLTGTGKVWADDLRLLVDGQVVWEASGFECDVTALDHEFDGGSKLVLQTLSPAQVENLTTLGKVWGFLKYHHPRVTAGEFHFDYELFRIMPAVLAAADRAAANAALLEWISGLGSIESCSPCATLDENGVHLRPRLGWIYDQTLLGAALSEALHSIHRKRPAGKQFYVSMTPVVGNPVFERELTYRNMDFLDSGFRILGLYRFWNLSYAPSQAPA